MARKQKLTPRERKMENVRNAFETFLPDSQKKAPTFRYGDEFWTYMKSKKNFF